MNFRPFHLSCECGRVPFRFKSAGLTAAHQLVIHWRCLACNRLVYVVKDLGDCWRECPRADSSGSETAAAIDTKAEDSRFLRRLGISDR
jgi:hypothetical protein